MNVLCCVVSRVKAETKQWVQVGGNESHLLRRLPVQGS